MVRGRFLAIFTMHSAGCGDCHEWDAVEITDPDGVAGSEQVDGAQAALGDLAGWTGRAETCISGMRFVEDLHLGGDKVGGFYKSSDHSIRLESEVGGHAVRRTARHEICHGIDHEEGWISEENPDIFGERADAVDTERYPTETGRMHEAFAHLCQQGPQLGALATTIEDACSVDVTDDATRFVHELLFTGSVEDVDFPRYSADIAWEDVGGTGRSGLHLSTSIVSGADGLFLLDLAWDEEAELVEPVLMLIEPETEQVTDSLALDAYTPSKDANGNPTFLAYSLIGSNTDPLLLSVDGEHAWRIHTDPLSIEPIDFPMPDPLTATGGFELDGQALLDATYGGDDAVFAVDLDSGAITMAGADRGEDSRPTHPWSVVGDADGAVVAYEGNGMVIAGVGFDGQITWEQDLVYFWHVSVPLARLPDGQVLVTPFAYTWRDGMQSQIPLPLLLDTDDGVWSAPDSDCFSAYSGQTWVTWQDRTWTVTAVEDGDTYSLRLGTLSVTR